MTGEREALYRAVLEAPDDDAPRLVFADFLDETGDPLGQFIRLQMASDSVVTGLPEKRLLKGWVTGRSGCNALHWLGKPGGLAPFANVSKRTCYLGWSPGSPQELRPRTGDHSYIFATFRRGFVSEISCPAAAWLERAAAFCAAHPVAAVRLTTSPAYANPRYDGSGKYDYGWCDHHNLEPNTSHIGPKLYALLPRENELPHRRAQHFTFYATREEADAALSRACVAYGRQLAGFP